jgi:hypothetical protein
VAACLGVAAVGCTKPDDAKAPAPGKSETQGTTVSGGASFGLPKDPGAAIKAAGLPELSPERSQELAVVHDKAHLEVAINGQPVTVPNGIGVTTNKNLSPMHTTDDSGVVRVEAEKPDTFTIGQFFTEWGVKLDKNCLATFCTDDKNQLLGYVNGQLVPDPASIPISQHAAIVVWYGPKGTNPKVPATYAFT